MPETTDTTAVHLTISRTLLARAEAAADVEGVTRPEYMRRAILAACERTDALAARRARTAKQGREG